MRRNSFHQAVRLSTLESAVCQGVWDILKCPCTLSTFPLLLGYKFPHFIVPLIPRPAASVHLSALPTFFGGANLRKHRRCRRHLHSRQYLSLSLSPRSFGGRTRSLPPSFPSPHVRTPDSRLSLTYLSLSLPLSLALPSSPIRCRFSDIRPPRPSSPERRR